MKKKSEDESKAIENETVINGGNTNTVSLLKRAFMFLEDGDWQRADEYCEKVLDIKPECAEAYLGKLMAELQVRKQEDLKDCKEPFDEKGNYQKIIRFADDSLVSTLLDYLDYINARNEDVRLKGIYSKAKNAMDSAKSEGTYKEAAELFNSIGEYKDSASLAKKCLESAEVAKQGRILSEAETKMAGDQISNYEEAIKLLESISGWRSVDEKINICQKKIEELKIKAEEKRLEREMQEEADHKNKEQLNRKIKIIAKIAISTAIIIVLFIALLNAVIIPNVKYNEAVSLMEAGKYEEAITAFEKLDGYKDSEDKIAESIIECKNKKYNEAVSLMEAGKYEEAIVAFEELGGYKDSKAKIDECNYNNALAFIDDGNYVDAYESLIALDGYKDSKAKAESICSQYLKSAEVGDCVLFGKYEQDNDTSNGKEVIEWLILAKEENRVLVISEDALDWQPYNTIYEDITWETCTLRTWLNNDFLNSAFTDGEKAMLSTTMLSADKNPEYDTNPGNATQDKVFLLSIDEANRYFITRACQFTDYAGANGAFGSDDGNCAWWLRSPGVYQDSVAYVTWEGRINTYGVGDIYLDAVRPALWIDLNR